MYLFFIAIDLGAVNVPVTVLHEKKITFHRNQSSIEKGRRKRYLYHI